MHRKMCGMYFQVIFRTNMYGKGLFFMYNSVHIPYKMHEKCIHFLKKNLYIGQVIDNKFQPHIDKTVKYLYDPNSGAEAIRIGFGFLKQVKRVAFVKNLSF